MNTDFLLTGEQSGEIIISPETLNLATGVEGSLEIGGFLTRTGIPAGFNTNLFEVPASVVGNNELARFTKVGGGDSNAVIQGIPRIPKKQPFHIQMGGFRNGLGQQNFWLGAVDNLGRITAFNPFNYPPEEQIRFYVSVGGTYSFPTYYVGANFDGFMVKSDGTSLSMWRFSGGFWRFVYSFTIPEDVTFYRWFLNIWEQNSSITLINVGIEEKTTTLTPNDLTFNVQPFANTVTRKDATRFYLTANDTVNRNIVVSHPDLPDETKTIPVNISSLYLRPKGGACGGFVVRGQAIEFETNGGDGSIGDFDATAGTIVGILKWQAPFSDGQVNFSYTIGEVTATCVLNVVPKLEVEGVFDGQYSDVVQGERVNFKATVGGAQFTCAEFPTIVTRRGKFLAPTDAMDDVFGEKMCRIKVEGGGQEYYFWIYVQPMYPSEDFCGARHKKWLTPLPDFLPNRLQMGGGTTQVKNRNADGIYTFQIDYESLTQEFPAGCSCDSGALFHRCDGKLATAKRLDEFYLLMKGTTKRFSVLDVHTKVLFKGVRLTEFSKNHDADYVDSQTRRVAMRYEGDGTFKLELLNPPELPEAIEGEALRPTTTGEHFWIVKEW